LAGITFEQFVNFPETQCLPVFFVVVCNRLQTFSAGKVDQVVAFAVSGVNREVRLAGILDFVSQFFGLVFYYDAAGFFVELYRYGVFAIVE